MNMNIYQHEEVVEECDRCMFSGPRIVGGDDTIICRRCPYPHTKWWFDQICPDYKKNENHKD